MIILEALPWLASFVVLGAMAVLARSAFSSGEFAGRPEIHAPEPPATSKESEATQAAE